MFSPYYAHARRRAGTRGADPLNHCALNVALYRRNGQKLWAMTERGRDQVRRDATTLQIGPSAMQWNADGGLRIRIDEVGVPWLARLRGEVRVHPRFRHDRGHPLDPGGVHLWTPIAPVARVEVEMRQPALAWSGDGYLDSNRGGAPLEHHFAHWHWARAALPGERAAVLYDVMPKRGPARTLALAFDRQGGVEPFTPPPVAALPRTGWGIDRATRCDSGHAATVAQTFEDGPFYARSRVSTRVLGLPASAMHESLSLRRFEQLWVQSLLPVRMPRIAR